MTGKEMSSVVEPDKLSMVMYLSQFYEMFKDTVPPGGKSGSYSRALGEKNVIFQKMLWRLAIIMRMLTFTHNLCFSLWTSV